jgi:hypothetical protein
MAPAFVDTASRDRVMTLTAYGYQEAKWLDNVIPRDAHILTTSPNALLRRPFGVFFLEDFGPGAAEPTDAQRNRLRGLIRGSGAQFVVLPYPFVPGEYPVLARCLGARFAGPAGFYLAARHAFNRVPYKLQVFRLSCTAVGAISGQPVKQ